MSYRTIPTQKLHELFEYDAVTGRLFWRARPRSHFGRNSDYLRWNGRFAGEEAGTLHASKKSSTTYRIVKVLGFMVLTHIIVWAMSYGEWPALTIDHKDLNGLNNRVDNLRLFTQAEQLKNRPKRGDNTSGKTGVTWHKGKGMWVARISINGVETQLGVFIDKQDAIKARVIAEMQYNYETGTKEGYGEVIV